MSEKFYECQKCGKWFTKKSHYHAHKNMITNCVQEISVNKELVEPSKYACTKCDITFSTKGNLIRHLNNKNSLCRTIGHIVESKLDEIFQKKLGGIHIEKLNIRNSNSAIQNILQPIFVKHGKENMGHISKEVILELLNKKFENICVTLMNEAYFNRRVPKNHNWCLAYPNNEKGAIVFNYEENEFIRESTEDTINAKFTNLLELLSPIFSEIIHEENLTGFLNKTQRANLIRIQHFCNIDKLSEEAKALYNDIRKIAYNNRKIPMKTWDESGFKGNHLSLKFN